MDIGSIMTRLKLLRRILIVYAVIVFYYDLASFLPYYGVHLPLSPSYSDMDFTTLLFFSVIRIFAAIPVVVGFAFVNRAMRQNKNR